MEPNLFVPGDEQYDFNQSLEPVGIAPLVQEPGSLPDLKQIATNVIKNKAIDYAARKIGLDAVQASGLASILGVGANAFAPLAAVSALTGKSFGISEYLANKRAQKQAKKNNIDNDPQGTINTVPIRILNMQPTAQDIARGDRSTPTPPSPKSPGVANPYSGGIGGIHSGYR